MNHAPGCCSGFAAAMAGEPWSAGPEIIPAGSGTHRRHAPADLAEHPPCGDTDRLRVVVDTETWQSEWYFRAREGLIGPYPSRACAKAMLIRFKARCRRAASAGGRVPTFDTGRQIQCR